MDEVMYKFKGIIEAAKVYKAPNVALNFPAVWMCMCAWCLRVCMCVRVSGCVCVCVHVCVYSAVHVCV